MSGLVAILIAFTFVSWVVPPYRLGNQLSRDTFAQYWFVQIGFYHQLNIHFYLVAVLVLVGPFLLGVSVYQAVRSRDKIDRVWAVIATGVYVALALYLLVVYQQLPHYSLPEYCRGSAVMSIGEAANCALPD